MFPIAAMLIGTFKHDRTYLSVPRRAIRQGVTAYDAGGLPVLVVRSGDTIRAVVAAMAPNHRVVVCGPEFVDADTRRHYAADGAGLEQVLVTEAGASIRIHPDHITAPPGQAVFRAQATGDWQDQSLHPDPAVCA